MHRCPAIKPLGHLLVRLSSKVTIPFQSSIADRCVLQLAPVHMPIGIGGSMSTSSPKMVTGWHVLNVEGYSRTKRLPPGKSIKSSTFTVGGHSWYIGYCPSGFGIIGSISNCESISFQLNLHHPAASGEVLAQFSFSLVDHTGEKVLYTPYLESDTIYTFSSKTESHGVCGFMKKTALELFFLNDDSFIIRCDVTVIKDIHAEDDPVALPPRDLHRHLGDLLDNELGGDVTFDVNGELFTAHWYVHAARSSVFMAQLFGPMKEKTASHVCIDDMDARVFKVMLRFIYTDMLMLPDMEDDEKTVMSQHLLVAADRYNMDRLKLMCEHTLRKQINTDIIATTLVLAEQRGCCGLKNACFKFLMCPGNLKKVMASDSFQL